MKQRLRLGGVFCIWPGCAIILFSPIGLWITQKDPIEFYFTQDYFFYEWLICLAILFALGFAIGGGDSKRDVG